jgi:hypothetical protein
MRVSPNPFERLSEIAFELIMAVSFTGVLRDRRQEIWNRTIGWPVTSRTISAQCSLAGPKPVVSVNL